jgi:hypothetical protein
MQLAAMLRVFINVGLPADADAEGLHADLILELYRAPLQDRWDRQPFSRGATSPVGSKALVKPITVLLAQYTRRWSPRTAANANGGALRIITVLP